MSVFSVIFLTRTVDMQVCRQGAVCNLNSNYLLCLFIVVSELVSHEEMRNCENVFFCQDELKLCVVCATKEFNLGFNSCQKSG